MKNRKSALIVVDAQKIYTNPNSELYCQDSVDTISRINRLIDWFESKNALIIFVRHIHKADGSDLGRMFDYLDEPFEDFNFKEETEEVEYDNNLHMPSNAEQIVKTRYSSFANTNLDAILKHQGIERIVVCGFMTNFCCESTARSAHDNDYFVDFVLDATGTPGTENFNEADVRTAVGDFLASGFARVMSTVEWIESQ